MNMKSKIRSFSVITIIFAIIIQLSVIPNLMVVGSSRNSGIIPGLSLMGAYGDGQSYFIPRENLVTSAQILAGGWGTIERQEGIYDWSEFYKDLANYAGTNKKAALIVQSSAHNTRETPRWFYEKYGVRQITARGVFFDFEASEPNTQSAQAKIYGDGGEEYTTTISRGTTKSNGILTRTTNGDLISSTNHLANFDTQMGFDYWGSGTVRVTVQTGGTTRTVREYKSESGKKSAMFLIERGTFNANSTIRISSSGGTVSIDNLSISARTDDNNIFGPDRNLCYPNIFDPIFIQKQHSLAEAIYQEFKNHPNVGGVFVGGLGRWNELSLMGDSRQENDLLMKQWRAYGYDDDRYIEHIDTMCRIYSDIFPGEMDITLLIAAFSLPNTGLGTSSGDVNYVGYAANNKAVKYGFASKHNGLTEKYTEWGQAVYAFNFFANRNRYNPNTSYKLEAAIQINNPWAYWMGHPHSVFNRIMIDQMDNYFLYSMDLKLPFVMKYAHTANEQAGNALFTRYYNILKRTPFNADHTWWPSSGEQNTDRILRNLWNGLYLVNERSPSQETGNDEHKNNYAVVAGREVIKTSPVTGSIRFSLDDRQSYNVLYGSHIAITYYDTGTGTFDVRIRNTDGAKIIGSVQRMNSNIFKTAHFYAGDFFDTKHNGNMLDVEYEIEILSKGGTDYVNNLEILTVPSIDWRETNIRTANIGTNPQTETIRTGSPISFNIPANPVSPVSSIDVFVGTKSSGYVLLEAKVFEVTGNSERLLTTKEFFMPGEIDKIRLPVAKASHNTQRYRVEITRPQAITVYLNSPTAMPHNRTNGSAYIIKDTSGNYAYNSRTFSENEGNRISIQSQNQIFEAHRPFYGVRITSREAGDFSIHKEVGSDWVEIFNGRSSGNGSIITFEPQNPGRYIIRGLSGSTFTIANLQRRAPSHNALRYNLGSVTNPEFKNAYNNSAGKLWEPKYGVHNQKFESGIWSGELYAANPYIETKNNLNITPGRSQIFHFIIKNETPSDMIKLYWKNAGDIEFTEQKSAYITVVPNDDRFREYSYPIGQEASAYYFDKLGTYTVRNNSVFTYADTSKGKITGFKVVPVVGNTITSGKISIVTMSLRDNDTVMSSFRERLDIPSVMRNEEIFKVNATGNLAISPTPTPGLSNPAGTPSISSGAQDSGADSDDSKETTDSSSGDLPDDSKQDSDSSVKDSLSDNKTQGESLPGENISGEEPDSQISGDGEKHKKSTNTKVLILIAILSAGAFGGIVFAAYKKNIFKNFDKSKK